MDPYIRDSKTFGFIVVNDGSYFEPLQVVYHDKMENFEEISKQNVGAIIVTGRLVATPQAKQPFEIQADEVTVEGASAPDYPLQKKRHSFEYLIQFLVSASENEYISGCIQSAFYDRICDSSVLPGKRVRLCAYTTDHRK